MDVSGPVQPDPPHRRRRIFEKRRWRVVAGTVAFVMVNAIAVVALAGVSPHEVDRSCGGSSGGFSGYSGGGCGADLQLTMLDSPDPVKRGEDLFYFMEILNRGPGDAYDVQISDKVPTGMQISWVMVPAGDNPYYGTASCQVQGLAVFCNTYYLQLYHKFAVTLVLRPLLPGTYRNIAKVDTGSFDEDITNNSAAVRTTVSG